MYDHRPFATLGRFDNDWLSARYHFSFSNYFDPARTGVGPLLVWNDDRIAPHTGFPPHGHRDMEIITYVRSGAVSHTDSFGNDGRIRAGEVQVMSAGTGIRHSEMNAEDVATTLFQIWIEPRETGLKPVWAQRSVEAAIENGLTPLVSGSPQDGVLTIHQDATVYLGRLAAGATLDHALAGRLGYLVPISGSLAIADGPTIDARDGLAIAEIERLHLTATQDVQFLLADLPR